MNTPRTDAFLLSIGVTNEAQFIGLEAGIAAFARQLEGELMALPPQPGWCAGCHPENCQGCGVNQ